MIPFEGGHRASANGHGDRRVRCLGRTGNFKVNALNPTVLGKRNAPGITTAS